MFTENTVSTDFIDTRRYFDTIWQDRYGFAMHDWLVNGANGDAKELRRMACFLTPDRVYYENGYLIFQDSPLGNQAKQIMAGSFPQTLQAAGLKVHEQQPPPAVTWDMMPHNERMGFAKAIWYKRDYVGRGDKPKETFEPYVQEALCRMKQAPNPQELLAFLAENGTIVD